MNQINREIDEIKEKRVLLIACYKKRYTNESLQQIVSIINDIKPDSVIILKLIKTVRVCELLDANIGFGDLQKFQQYIKQFKKEDVDEVGVLLIKTINKLGIPYDVHVRVGENISQQILNEFNSMNVVHLIMHPPSKGFFQKLIEASAEDFIYKILGKNKVTFLD
ncbi:MAG: hypothetical protein R6V50_05625 [Thermoplasmatota archaeon]